ncbi:hypothetical protein RirG_174800 [Rhizophagus irregularis DAOM 197198w]|uniref:Uncharacterized protein n=1 Tax=Rhizophagus irregularis (strain DAOM 197198w) TaxID=1432141 RepID=A0A015KMP8_RHIIW|nr:hypothetical protein RirG_174800 [Rhizophagus irregularis DAOM 197198w]
MDAEFPQNEIDKIAQDFANHVQWSPQPIPKYLQKHFDSNYDPSKIERIEDYSAFENLHINIKFAELAHQLFERSPLIFI